jgi:roadblock/LC7 domain-containing protein
MEEGMRRVRSPGLAMAVLVALLPLEARSADDDIRPLRRHESWILQSPSVFNGREHWQVGRTRSTFERADASDGTPIRCALTVRAVGYFVDPALESVQVGVERFPATSRPDALDGTMFVRVRFADTTTWRAVPVEGLVAALDRTTTTASWRVGAMEADGYTTISRPTALAGKDEKEAFGWMAADGEFQIRIARASGVPIREYAMGINRIGYIDEAVFDMIACLMAMGNDPVTFGAILSDQQYAINPVQVPPSRRRP